MPARGGQKLRMYSSIVVGTDGSETATEAVRQAAGLARAFGAMLDIVSAYEPASVDRLRVEQSGAVPDPRWAVNARGEIDQTLQAAATLARGLGVTVNVFARQGDPADSILDVAEERGADLIVIGNKGLTGAQRFLLGSVPNKISHHAPCSVLIIRTG